jgi:N-acetylglucosamine malate deacetylase 2
MLSDIRARRALCARPRAPRVVAGIEDLPHRSALVIVAHPDDEVIAAGALFTRLPKAGVICFTDGAPRKSGDARAAGFDNWLDYAAARRQEAEAALALLGRDLAPRQYLGIADQEIIFNLVAATRFLIKPLRSGFDYIVTHPYEGGHPDHDAVAFAVHAACALIARSEVRPPIILEAAFYNSAGGDNSTGRFIPDPDAGDSLILPLDSGQQALKRKLIDCHFTQRNILREFQVDHESFRAAPRYHFAAPSHPGSAGYNRFGWPMNDKIWRRYAWGAINELGLREELA